MTRRAISIYMAATCATVVVAPGRFVCGIVLAAELCLLMFFGVLFKMLLSKLKMENLTESLLLCFIVFFTMLIKQLLVLLMPELALQLSFVIYLPSISTFTTVFLLEEKQYAITENIRRNMAIAAFFAEYILIVSLIRDIFGYGTITLPSYGSQLEKVLINSDGTSSLAFLATIPGALILTALLLSLFVFLERKFDIIKRAELSSGGNK